MLRRLLSFALALTVPYAPLALFQGYPDGTATPAQHGPPAAVRHSANHDLVLRRYTAGVQMDTTLTVAIVLIVIGVLALLVGVALEARTRRPR